ncbi:hypothetical protein [Pseudomonas indica]|uniref:hypothetical protein n=1 Tax=Pseudomonas indica TaxID=137658 RepID=UPI000BC887B3|nr:hypothetical protein [Pseudomonas indica]PAU60058.1 hypothetical protein BZL42_10820 [Pseudomonas indica]
MSLGSILGNAASTAINITVNVTPMGRGLGLANELLGGGTQDLAGALTDTLMKGLFGEPDKKGISKFNDWNNKSADNPLLKMLAEFMDASNGAYGKPDGKAGNWKDELTENDTVNQQERDAFGQGLKDALSMFLDQAINEAIMGAALGSMLGGGLGGGLGNMLGGGLGGGLGDMLGGGLGGGLGNMLGGGLGGGLGSMLGGGLGGGLGDNLFGNNPFAGGTNSTPFGENPFAGGLSGLGSSLLGGGLSGMAQTGMGFGLDLASHMSLQKLSDIGTHVDGQNRHFINEENRGTAKEIGKFMDQHPEIFGKPEYQKDGGDVKTDTKSWAEALSNPDDDGMTGESMDKFHKATNIMKDVMLGDTSQCPSKATAGDAMLAISNIASEGLSSAARG